MTDFAYDVFLSHSSRDEKVVRALAERLRNDGVRVWFADWEIRPGDSIFLRLEEGLLHSRVLVLCFSKNINESEWRSLESGTFRFRDPLDKERRFIPLHLDDSPIPASISQYSWIDWRPRDRSVQYAKFLAACLPVPSRQASTAIAQRVHSEQSVLQLQYGTQIYSYSFSRDGEHVLSAGDDNRVRLWDLRDGTQLRVLEGHTGGVRSVVWCANPRRALTGADDATLRLWNISTRRCLRVLEGHDLPVRSVAVSPDDRLALSGSDDKTARVWDLATGRCLKILEGHNDIVWSGAWSSDRKRALSASADRTVRLWDVGTGRCLFVLEGHTSGVGCVAWSVDQSRALSGAVDKTLRLWDLSTGRCILVMEGHTGEIRGIAWSDDQRYAISGADDRTIRIWDLNTGQCVHVFDGHDHGVTSAAWTADRRFAYSGDEGGEIRVWNVAEAIGAGAGIARRDQVQYTNAKVLLVGESGVGKTGLSRRLALGEWSPSDSTVGVWATQWKLPMTSSEGVEREIWLWDFGGQADQRLIHQLYMDEAAMAVLVFDGQKDDLFETLSQWDRELSRAARPSLSKLLVAGRVDAGGLRVSRRRIEAFQSERDYRGFLETSAKTNAGCWDLRDAIVQGIQWDQIPWRSSPRIFKELKEEIVALKENGRALMRFNELRETLRLQMGGAGEFTDEELRAVVSLLSGPGIVWELKFGNWILLQPERVNAYAQAVIQTLREDPHERGAISEERVLNGDLAYQSSLTRLGRDEERFVLLAMHQTLIERGLCFRQHTDHGPILIFPSYYRRERPELVSHPAILVTYRFNGFLDDVYATLVVRLHNTAVFEHDALWHDAADFKTLSGKQLGIKMTRLGEGTGEFAVYFDPTIPMETKAVFVRYIHEHLVHNATDVARFRHYVCPHCGAPVGNSEIAMHRLAEGKQNILCINCEQRVPLWDQIEELFASPETKRQVRALEQQASIALDHESKERVLVGEVISTVALAAQIIREFSVSDHGIDMEIEFRDDAGEALGRKVYLVLKSGDNHLLRRKRDGAEILNIREEHARYWASQRFPVILMIRTSDGQVRWMDVRESLRRKNTVKQIVFAGERFDVLSVRRWREEVLADSSDIAGSRIERAEREHLAELSLAGLRLDTLPGSLWTLTDLESLDLSGNRLKSIPDGVARLTRLKSLNVANNRLESLPPALRGLTLEELFLHNNVRLGLPREILGPTAELTRSSRGSLDPPNVTTPAAILDYYFSTRGGKGLPLREVKVIVVGRGSAGKTSLIRRLEGKPLNRMERETHGISISPLRLEGGDGVITARLWDFGGQHILHAMHEFFLTARSVYLLVLGDRDDMAERDATYWLQLIRSYAGTVPVVVALNKSGGRQREMDRESLEREYGPIVGWVATECDETLPGSSDTIERLRTSIIQAAEQMPELRDLFPAAWTHIKNWLEEMPDPYIDLPTFQARCAMYGEHDRKRQKQLSDRLHDLGIALSFSRDPRLRNTTVLKPDWLANGVYALLRANDPTHERRFAPDALLTLDRVGEIYAQAERLEILRSADYPREKWPFLLSLMMLFQLAFPIDQQGGTLLVPALLPLEPAAGSEEPTDIPVDRLRYEFSVVPAPLVPRFLVRVFALIDGSHYWRRGALLRYAGARARVSVSPDERWIHVDAWGPTEDRDELLEMVRGTLDDLFLEYVSLKVTEYKEFDGQWVPRETLERYEMRLRSTAISEDGR